MSEIKKPDFTVVPIYKNDSKHNDTGVIAPGVEVSDTIVRYSISTTPNAPITSRPQKPTKDSGKKDK